MKFNALSHSTLKITTRNDISKTCAESFHNINIFTRVVCGISDQIRITFQVLQDLMKSKKEVRQCLFQGECNKTKVYGGFNYIPSQKLFVDVQPLSFLAEKRKIKESL